MSGWKKIPKLLKKILPISVLVSFFVFLVCIFFLITNHLLIVLPFDQGSTKVAINKSALQQSLKLAGIDQLIIRPSIIVKISSKTPHPEKLIRFQRTTFGPEGFTPSFGCNYDYSKMSRRIVFLNLYIRGGEYLERITDDRERVDLLNQATLMCLVDLISPSYHDSEKKIDNILKEFDLFRNENSNIFEFRTN